MFIKKITKIKNVGKFKQANIRGGEYKKYTLIYGGNGRGKTTLCAIFRSLQLNAPNIITTRRTFKVTAKPEVQLLLDSGPVTFNGNTWAAHHSDIHIFDQQFILENIYTGDEVGIDQRRNFYRIVVGPTGVGLATEIDNLDQRATAAQTAINAEKKVLQQHVPTGMTIEDWLAIPSDPDIAIKINAAKIAVDVAENSAEIGSRTLLGPIPVPALPVDFHFILTKGLPELAAEATDRVNSQMMKHNFHGEGEAWLATGLSHIAENDCPFCGQSVAGNVLIEAYQGFFSEAYAAHVKTIQDMIVAITSGIGPSASLKVSQGVAKATADAEFWQRYIAKGVVMPTDLNSAAAALTELYSAAKTQMEVKLASPLETPPASTTFDVALEAWERTTASLAITNASIADANVLIETVKTSSASSTLVAAKSALAHLETVEKRHKPAIEVLVAKYWLQVAAKKDATESKEAKKAELDAYDTSVFGGYECDINKLLEIFNAPFKLVKCGKTYQGKLPQSAYCLQFDGHDVDVAASAKNNVPTFNTTLSAGDKNTFSLAFFLAQIKRDPDISKKVVVFDDPFTSLDDFRREMTAKAIFRVGENAAQIIVFSHDKYFLDAMYKKILNAADKIALQVAISGGNASIEDWPLEREVREGYLQEHMALCDYAQGLSGDAASMRTRMRPLLEQYIRYRFPNQIQDGHWLGDMLGVIRADATHPLTGIYSALEDINDYTKTFHHDPSSSYNDQEVLAHVKRTLAIVGGWSS